MNDSVALIGQRGQIECKLTSQYTFVGASHGRVAKSADQTRQRILQAAYKLFRRRGFFRVGVDEIAAAAGITKRTLYYHFKSKDALLAAVLASQHEQDFAAFQTFGIELSGSPEKIVDALFRELAIWSAKPRWAGSGFTRACDGAGRLARSPRPLDRSATQGRAREISSQTCWPGPM